MGVLCNFKLLITLVTQYNLFHTPKQVNCSCSVHCHPETWSLFSVSCNLWQPAPNTVTSDAKGHGHSYLSSKLQERGGGQGKQVRIH